jgi:hypothetical protein
MEGLQITVVEEDDVNDIKLDSDKPPKNPTGKKRGRPPGSTVARAKKSEAKDMVKGTMLLVLLPISAKDPICGGAFVNQADEIADAVAEIAMRNPKFMDFLMSGGDAMIYLKLAMALTPALRTVLEHHDITRLFNRGEIEVEENYGANA